MVSSRTFVLECRADRVVLAAFSQVGSVLTLNRVDVEPVAPGAACNAAAGSLAAIQGACATLRRRAPRSKHRLALVLPAPQVLLKSVALPPVSAEQRAKLLPFEAAQAIPYPLAEVAWGAAVVSETDLGCEVLIAAIKREVIEPLCTAVEDAGFEIAAVVPAPFATLAGFESSLPSNATDFLGLNLSTDSGTVVFVGAGLRLVRVFRLRAPENAMGPTASDDELARLRAQVVQEVARSLLHFHWRGSPRHPAIVKITGALSSHPDLVAALAHKLGSEVTVLDAPRDWKSAPGRAVDEASAAGLEWLDLRGAARLVTGSHGINVNLLPARLQYRAESQRRRPWLAAAAVMLVIAGALPAAYVFVQRRDVHAQRVAWERSFSPEQARATRNAANLRRIAALRVELKEGAALAHQRLRWRQFLEELTTVIRDFDGLWFDDLGRVGEESIDTWRWRLKGQLLAVDPGAAEPSGAEDEAGRVARILERLGKLVGVAGIEAVRFDRSVPGLIGFEVTLVGRREHHL